MHQRQLSVQAFALILLGSILGYFVAQVLAAFVAFFIYGSGEAFSANSKTVSGLFVAGQLVLVFGLFYRKGWIKEAATLLLALLVPVGLFLALET